MHPEAVEGLHETEIDRDTLQHRSESVGSPLGDRFDGAVTAREQAKEIGSFCSEAEASERVSFPDPSFETTCGGNDREAFREVRDEIAAWGSGGGAISDSKRAGNGRSS